MFYFFKILFWNIEHTDSFTYECFDVIIAIPIGFSNVVEFPKFIGLFHPILFVKQV